MAEEEDNLRSQNLFIEFIQCSGYSIHETYFSESLNQKIILILKRCQSNGAIAMKQISN